MTTGYIKSSEYEAWARLNRVRLGPSELQILKRLDRLQVAHDAKKASPETAAAPVVSSRPLSTEVFDALWS